MLLAVDPGADQGWALFDDGGLLVGCGLGGVPVLPMCRIDRAVIERPAIYPGGRQKARPRDVITLALRAGETGGVLRSRGCSLDYVEPRTWKGGAIDKEIMGRRVLAKLSEAEKRVFDEAGRTIAPGKRHNMLDAVGIGLYACRR